ncbi:ABC transporter substrate-binding protein (plasmid) [Nocardioides sp. R1-1]|uniref:ABC transporter substrate-binding protein n=1 Tax=Nocardioides sp. R1-1 TaxID=3383502 RepID=UPI0038CF987D
MSKSSNPSISRRSLLQSAGLGLAAVAVTGVAAGCSSSSPGSGSTSGKPVRGGTLRAGLTGGSTSDTLDAAQALNNVDFARSAALYEPLIGMNNDAHGVNVLAESIEPSSDATSWTIRLKPGITFHNGKPVTADDVLFTLRRVIDNGYAGSAALVPVDIENARKLDPRTLKLPCHRPYSVLDEAMYANSFYLGIVPTDYDPMKPVGTGAFTYKSFTPGQESVFAPYSDYWGDAAYVDSLVISNYDDETAQLNALQSGQIDLINQLSSTSIEVAKASGQVLVSQGGGSTPFVMRCDKPPFNDVRVRQALRLVIDRPALNDVVFNGEATIGNDVFSPWDPNYDSSIPQREQDIDQAKSLLASAGQSDLTVTLVVADISYGAVQAAQVFADQAKAAGITVEIQKVTVAEFFGSNFLSWDFSVDAWYYAPYLSMAGYTTTPNAPYPETHFSNEKYNSLYEQAISTVDADARRELSHEMQQIDYDEGGYIIPQFSASIDAASKKVHGMATAKTGLSFGNFDFKSMWIS